MCGIVGIYSYKKPVVREEAYIKKCLQTMRRRGPDASGTWHNKQNYIAGFVRLSIRDLSEQGNQPMLSACGNYCISFNGEIYNSDRFKSLLSNKGIVFKSTSDTEVLLYGLIHLGIEKVLEEYDGIFAFAFYNRLKDELILARDRVGVKPLYIGFDSNDGLIYSSQYDHVINYNSIRDQGLNYGAIGSYLQLGYMADNMGVVKNTLMFPHGHYAIINRLGFQLKRYFSVTTRLNLLSENINEDVFEQATSSQLVSDVPVASYLSGGVDSGLISVWSNKHQHVKAFTIGTDDEFTNEHEAAASFAKSAQIEQCIYDIKEDDFLDVINDYFHSHTEPFADFSSIPSLLLSRLVGSSYKVILSGDGPDELFWGYDRNIKYMKSACRYFHAKWKLSGELFYAKLSGNKTVINRRMIASKDFYTYYYQSLFTFGSLLLPSLYREKCEEAFFVEEIRKTYTDLNPADHYMYIMRDMEMNINLQRILLKVDRSGMYNSVEVRVPYLSNNVIEVALREKWTNHICEKQGKYFLKKTLAAKAGKDYAFKPKKGFLMPMQKWLRQSIKDDVREKILNMPPELNLAFRHKELKKLLHNHIDEGKDYSGIIWAIYALVNWYQLHRINKNLFP